tara:strand:+ start:6232 stop:7326 length:1095 start_codon:yes stop_codon:yes gene_type:complete
MESVGIDSDVSWSYLEATDFIWVIVMLSVALGPFISAIRNETSVALAMVLSLLLVMFVQFTLSMMNSQLFEFYPIHIFSVIPAIFTGSQSIPAVAQSTIGGPAHFHRIITSGWLHADFIHVLGNVLVIALAGVPLEQRLGPKRWVAVYFLGLLGGNIAWIASHPDSMNPAIGASGAAFGLLGAYMACWPDDKIEFPLVFLIRAWPVWLIAFFRLGLEVFQIYSIQSGTAGENNIAHMAHVGGFFLAYILARPIARGGPSPLDDYGQPASGVSRMQAMREQAIARMGSLDNDPWTEVGNPLEGHAARVLSRLRDEGDELETRRAWLEELAENAICPICEGELRGIESGGVFELRCSISANHIRWP